MLGKDYEVITADDRLDKLADDFVEHCSTRWETRQVDAGLHRQDHLRADVPAHRAALAGQARRGQGAHPDEGSGAGRGDTDPDAQERLSRELDELRGQAQWMESTIIEIIISEAQNEVRDFQKWGFDIIPHRVVMKTGFQTPDGKRVRVEGRLQGPAASVPRRHRLRDVADRASTWSAWRRSTSTSR